jgi:Cft2 family RNA processing exonuclease
MIFLCYYNYAEPFSIQQSVSNNTDPNANNITESNANNITESNANNITESNANNITESNANNITESNADIDTKYGFTEGFDILGTEQNLQRGKKSNTIMVNEDMRKSSNVDPYDGCSLFTSVN